MQCRTKYGHWTDGCAAPELSLSLQATSIVKLLDCWYHATSTAELMQGPSELPPHHSEVLAVASQVERGSSRFLASCPRMTLPGPVLEQKSLLKKTNARDLPICPFPTKTVLVISSIYAQRQPLSECARKERGRVCRCACFLVRGPTHRSVNARSKVSRRYTNWRTRRWCM